MVRALAAACAVMICISLTGCKTDHESVMKDSISKMKELVSILKGVTDEASAKAAGPKIEAVSADMKKLQEDAKKLGDPPKDKQDELMKKYASELASVQADMMKESTRIAMNPKLSTILEPSMKNLSSGF